MRRLFLLLACCFVLVAGTTLKRGPANGPVDQSFYFHSGLINPGTAAGSGAGAAACETTGLQVLTLTTGTPVTQGWAWACDTVTVDGELHDSAVLPATFVAGSAITFEINAVMFNASPPYTGTLHGAVYAKCAGSGDVLPNAWTAVSDLDVVWATDTPLYETQKASASITPDNSCQPGDSIWFYYKLCDETASPTSDCSQSSVDAGPSTYILGITMTYSATSGY